MRDRVRKKRRQKMKRWKKKGKRLIPRKYLFKPPKRPDLAKNELWREIFLDDNEDDTTSVDTRHDARNTDLGIVGLEKKDDFILPPILSSIARKKKTKQQSKLQQAINRAHPGSKPQQLSPL
jgi:hypothetical protein